MKCARYLHFLPFRLLISLFPVICFEMPITRTFFDFPTGLKLSGVDCTWLNRRAGKMKRALFSHWLPEWVPQEQKLSFWAYNKSFNDHAWSFFGFVIDLAFVLVIKKAKKNLANQYPAMLTSRSVNNAHIY